MWLVIITILSIMPVFRLRLQRVSVRKSLAYQ
jgi:hypothetical protein